MERLHELCDEIRSADWDVAKITDFDENMESLVRRIEYFITRVETPSDCSHEGCDTQWLEARDIPYCIRHSCVYDDCQKFTKHVSCDKHSCKTCNEPVRMWEESEYEKYEYCADHANVCGVEFGHYGNLCFEEVAGEKYCKNHICWKFGCGNKKIYPKHNSCEKHERICLFKHCTKKRRDMYNAHYCYDHSQ